MPFLNAAKIMLRSLFKKPATAMYPVKKREYGAATRGSVANRIDSCIFCSLCAKKCPTGALNVSRDEKFWEIDRFKCITCGACVAVCPKKCLDMKNTYTPCAVKKSVERFRPAEKQPEAQPGEKA